MGDLQKKLYPFLFCALLSIVTGCQSAVFEQDTSENAILGNDKTLVMNSCNVALDQGVQVCRVKTGSPITLKFHAIIPWFKESFSSEVNIRFQDKIKSYAVYDSQFVLSWGEFFEESTWSEDQDGLIQIMVTTKSDGFYTRALGYVYIVVLKEGYSPLPIIKKEDRGSLCKVVYSENGRSSMYCAD